VPEDIGIKGLEKVVVRACIDHFHSGGFCFVSTDYNYERINFASYQPSKQLRAFADARIAQGQTQ
jgi:hypothetical protein